MEYKIEIDRLEMRFNIPMNETVKIMLISDHHATITEKDSKAPGNYTVPAFIPWKMSFRKGFIFHEIIADMSNVGMIFVSNYEIIMRLPDGDYGLEFTSALPVDLRIGDNHITGLQGTIPVKAVSSPFDQRRQTVGTQVNAVSVHGTGNVIGSMNIVNGDFVKGNKYSKR